MSKKENILKDNYKLNKIIIGDEEEDSKNDNEKYYEDNYCDDKYKEYYHDTISIIYTELTDYINSKDLFVGEYLKYECIDKFIKNNKLL